MEVVFSAIPRRYFGLTVTAEKIDYFIIIFIWK